MAFDVADGNGRETIYRVVKLFRGEAVGQGPYRVFAPEDGCVIFSSRTTRLQGRFISGPEWDGLMSRSMWSIYDFTPPRSGLLRGNTLKIIEGLFPRVRYSLQIRIAPAEVEGLLAQDIQYWLSRIFGGCRLMAVTGNWVDDADNSKDSYDGKLERVAGIEVDVSVLPTQCDLVKSVIRNIAQYHVDKYGLPIKWVHMEGRYTTANHTVLVS